MCLDVGAVRQGEWVKVTNEQMEAFAEVMGHSLVEDSDIETRDTKAEKPASKEKAAPKSKSRATASTSGHKKGG